MTDLPPSKSRGLPFSGKRNEPREVLKPLNSAIGPLMRQFRKYQAYHACLEVLDELFGGDLDGLAAPHDLRLVPGKGPDGGDVHALFLLVANQTVASVLEQKSRQLVERLNERLRVPMVEELRCETVPLLRVQRQLELLRLEPA